MATFNPDIGGTPSANMPDQTGASRGSIPDRSLEVIAEGIGTAVKGGVNLYNDWNHNQIDNEVRAGFDNVNQPFSDILPKDLTNTEAVLGSLQNAFEQGKISEVYYTGQLAKLQKQLRAQYPQYEDYIDSSLQRITGIRPANAFRNSVINLIEDNAKAASDKEKSWNSWVEQNGDWIAMSFPDYFENPERYVGYEDLIRSTVYNKQAVALEDTNENRRMERLAKAGQLSKEDAKTAALRTAETTVRNYMDATTNAMGVLSGQDLFKMLQGFLSDNVITDEEYAQGTQMINEFDKNIRMALVMQMSTPIDPNDPQSLSFNVMINDPKAVDDAIEAALQPWETIKQYALDKDFGLFTYYSRLNSLSNDREVNRILNASPDLKTVNALKQLGTTEMVNNFLTETSPKGTRQDSIFAEIVPEIQARVELGIASFHDTVKSIVDSSKSAEEKSNGINALLDASINRLTSKDISPENLKNLVNSIYNYDPSGESLFTKVVAGERESLYKNLFQPSVTDAIVKTGDQSLMQTYYNSMIASSKMVQSFTEASAAIQNTVQFSAADTIEYVPAAGNNAGKFVVSTDPSKYSKKVLLPGVEIPNPYQEYETTKAMNAVNSLNNVISGMNDVLTGLGVDDATKNEQIQQYVKTLGIDLGAAKPDSFFDQLGKVIQQGIDAITSEEGQKLLTGDPDKRVGIATGEYTLRDDEFSFNFDELSTPDTSNIPTENLQKVVEGTTAAEPQALLEAKTPLEVAQAFLGHSEKNKDQASVLAAFIKRTTGTDINPQDTAWCAAFMNAVLGGGTGKLNARSYLNWGISSADKPQKGDIVVLKRGTGWQGHVGFYMGTNPDGTIKVLAGNQGDAVTEKDWSASEVLDFRRAG